jgi:hypothetical protein
METTRPFRNLQRIDGHSARKKGTVLIENLLQIHQHLPETSCLSLPTVGMRCAPLVIVPTQSVGTKNPTHEQGQKIKSLVVNLVLNNRFKKGINFLHSRLHVRQLERNPVVKHKVARKTFLGREKTFSLPTTQEPLGVSIEKLIGERKDGGLRFRRQVIQ